MPPENFRRSEVNSETEMNSEVQGTTLSDES